MNSHHTVAIGTWEGDKQQSIEYNSSIAVGIDCPRAKLRVSILLDTIQEYQVRYIFSDEEISEAVNEAGLIIGARGIAYEGVLQRKPVIVVGEYGFGGLVTPDTLHDQCNKSRVLLFRTIRRRNKERICFDIPGIANDV